MCNDKDYGTRVEADGRDRVTFSDIDPAEREDRVDRKIGVCVIGGDKRQHYVAKKLASVGYSVSAFAVEDTECYSDIRDALTGIANVILPFPLSPDGITLNCFSSEKPYLAEIFKVISEACPAGVKVFAGAVKDRSREIAASFGVSIIDYGMIEEIALRNAVPTAEGAVEIAMRELHVTIRGASFAVVGYGRCGRELARLLKAMGAEVVGIARSCKDRAQMRNDGVADNGFDKLLDVVKSRDAVFNTVPFNVFDCHTLSLMSPSTVMIELASAPGGVDRECAARYGIKVIHAPSLPGKYAPESAAEIICDSLIPLML